MDLNCHAASTPVWTSGSRSTSPSRFHQNHLIRRENGAGQPRYDSEKDEKNSRDHNSIIFSYTTKTFPNCTAVSELHMEITPNQIFTLLGPVFFADMISSRMDAERPRRSPC